ncbi:choice-of-anchor D domain-containing protein, partial [Wenzhouxiangella sp. XN79A]|uniref:choice-of-anchor D domain-containing protein n=1 Tax=Wenzhouxiangella sp. XN79A TaxID=2724193 RepID=UPI00144A6919
ANGSFVFATPLDDLSAYAVTVLTPPTGPSQTCSVSNGSGNLAGANVTNVTVDCVTDTFTVGGTVSGLAGSGLVLQNNGSDDLQINANGSFVFATPLDDLSAYAVSVLTQPTSPIQTCTVSNGTGALDGADIDDVAVACVSEPPVVSLSAGTLDFGIVLDGDTSARSVTITNTGTGELVISQLIAPQAPFAISGGSCTSVPVTLLPGENCDIEVAFAPSPATGGFADAIGVVSNAASSPDLIALIGSARPLIVPTLDRFGLMILVLLLAGIAFRGLGGHRNGSRIA